MIDTLTLKNFKAFKHLDNLKLKPITILCGTNSSGKSSILQSILLLKQTIDSLYVNKAILLNGRCVDLGSFEDIIFEKKEYNSLTIQFKTIINENLSEKKIDKFYLSELLNFKNSVTYPFNIFFSFILSYQKEENTRFDEFEILINYLDDRYFFKAKRIENSYYEIEQKTIFEDGREDIYECNAVLNFYSMFPSIYEIEGKGRMVASIHNNLYSHYAKAALGNILSKYNYIGPLRQEPHREYIFRNEISEIGTKGENAAYFYWMEREKLIENHYFYNAVKDKFDLKDSQTLLDAVRYWLDLMGIQNFKPNIVNGIIYLELDSTTGEGTKVSLADVGFGVSQIFPIVLEGLRMDKGNTLILEQPEIHLHPKLQMQMADFFVSLALSDKRVLVETHSDHVVNRLVRRIVEDEEHDLQSLIGIYFIKPKEDGAVYEEVKIDADRGIVNWPEGFFDQTANEQERIIKAGLKKRKAKRNRAKTTT